MEILDDNLFGFFWELQDATYAFIELHEEAAKRWSPFIEAVGSVVHWNLPGPGVDDTDTDVSALCGRCRGASVGLRKCGGCEKIRYCSER
ncbi:hypothetical protein SISNIDRAFT_461174, partial [Sistotremastrum niveocremeum HHB9708]